MENIDIHEYYGDDALCYYQLATASFHQVDPTINVPGGVEDDGWRKKEAAVTASEAGGVKYCRLGAFMNGRLAGNVDSNPQLCRFDGHSVVTGHVGAVCSEPELRRGGCIRKLFTALVNRQYDAGVVLSHLEPFTANFYRKFGYEIAVQRVLWEIPSEYLPAYSNEGFVRYTAAETQKNDLLGVWRAFSAGCNLADDPTPQIWEHWLKAHAPYETGFYTFLHYTDGKADGAISYAMDLLNPEAIYCDMTSGAFWYTSPASQEALLRFLSGYRDYAKSVRLYLPENGDLTPNIEYTGGWSRKCLRREIQVNGTSRVINVEKALELAAYRGAGRVAVKVTDPTCERNCDTFTVEFDGRATSVRRGGEADIELSIGAFSVLLLGRGGLDLAPSFAGTVLRGREEDLRKVFYSKPVCYNRMG